MASPALEYTPELVEAEAHAATAERLNIQLLQRKALSLWATDETRAIDLGHALIAVRDAMFQQGHGNFAQWCRQNRIRKNRVNNCIRRAEGKGESDKQDAQPPRASLQLEKIAAAAVREILGRFTDTEANALILNKDSVDSVLANTVIALYAQFTASGVLMHPDNAATVAQCWNDFLAGLHRLVETAFVPDSQQDQTSTANLPAKPKRVEVYFTAEEIRRLRYLVPNRNHGLLVRRIVADWFAEQNQQAERLMRAADPQSFGVDE